SRSTAEQFDFRIKERWSSRQNRVQTLARYIGVVGGMGLASLGFAHKASGDASGYPWADATPVNLSQYEWGYTDCKPEVSAQGYCGTNIGFRDGVKYYE